MNNINYLTNTSTDTKQQSDKLWWKINTATNQYSCADLLLKICGINQDQFNLENFMLMVHPDYRNKIFRQILTVRETSVFDEKFPILTKFGYRWTRNVLIAHNIDEYGNQDTSGQIHFLNDNEVYLAQQDENKAQLNSMITRYNAVSDSLMDLMHVSDISTIISNTLQNLLDQFNGDRTYIFEYDMEQRTQSCAYEIVGDKILPAQNDLRDIPMNSTQWWTDMIINKRQPILYDNIKDLPAEAINEYELLSQQDITSIMIMPLETKAGVGGYLGIDIVGKLHFWTDLDKQWFQSLSNVISLCIELKKSQEIAEKEKEHYGKLYENMPIGFIRLKLQYDQSGKPTNYEYLQMNSVAQDLYDKHNNDIIGELYDDACDDCSTNFITKLDEIIKTRNIYFGKVALSSGKKHYNYTIYSVNSNEFVVLIQDNTEAIITLKALSKSEETLKNIYKNIPVGIEIYDKNGYLLSVNDTEQEIFGYKDQSEILGLNLFENPNVPQEFLDNIKNNMPSSCDFYYYFDKLDNYYGSKFSLKKHISLKGAILYDTDHNIENYLLIVLDNTNTLQANHKIKEFELLFSSIAEFSDVGLCQWNPSNKTIYATDQWYQNLNRTSNPISNITEAYSNLYEEDYIRLGKAFKALENNEIASYRDEVRVHVGDECKWLRCNYKVSDYRTEENNIEIIGINIDITELKSTELKLIQAKIKAEESDRLKSAFLANMSHEIRTPLNAIIGFSELLTGSEDIEEREQHIAIIKQNNELLLQLISDILDISKMESGTVEIKNEPVDIKNLCEEIVYTQAMKTPEDIAISLDKTDDYECIAIADKNHLIQILSNFVSNALKFTKKGYIRIGYTIEDEYIKFYVKDSGIGISPEQLSNIFNRFIKLNNFVSGTGLGLSICKTLVEKMKGTIWVESEYGVGSTFYFTIPYRTNTEMLLTDSESTSVAAVVNKENEALQIAEQAVILVAEDTDSNYLLINSVLKRTYKLIRANNGTEALELYKTQKPDLILMDMKMPIMGGLEATRKIREMDSQIPIIMLTAFAFDDDKNEAIKAGCSDFMTKPIQTAKLKETLATYLAK